jgi:hypothetical protein
VISCELLSYSKESSDFLMMIASNLRALQVVQAADVSEGLVLPLCGVLEALAVVGAESVIARKLSFYTVQTLHNIPGLRPDDLSAVLLLFLSREVLCQVLAETDILSAFHDDFRKNLENCLEIKNCPQALLQSCRWLPPHRAGFGPATSPCRLCKSTDASAVLGSVEDLLNWISDASGDCNYEWNNWLQGILFRSSAGVILIEEHYDGLEVAVMGNLHVFTGLIRLCLRSGDVSEQALHLCACVFAQYERPEHV